MSEHRPYNPLDLGAIAHNIETTLLQQEPQPLPPTERFEGAGIYAIYYLGNFPLYQSVSSTDCSIPIYVGRALPKGARQGKVGIGEPPGRVLFSRLSEHARSIERASNLELADFRCRFLVIEDLFVTLGERLTIQHFQPLWNHVIDGFGNHDPGSGRHKSARSDWDVLHPGRAWAERLAVGRSATELEASVRAHLDARASELPAGSTTTPIPPPPATD